MIRKLQHRFIRIAMAALSIAMVLVVAIVNIANWISVRNELSDTLSFLVEDRLPPAGDKPPFSASSDGTATREQTETGSAKGSSAGA